MAESGDYAVKLRNVTRDGLKVTGLGGLVFPDSDVKLVVHGRRFAASVSWVDQDTAGIKMKQPLSKEFIARIARTSG